MWLGGDKIHKYRHTCGQKSQLLDLIDLMSQFGENSQMPISEKKLTPWQKKTLQRPTNFIKDWGSMTKISKVLENS